MAANKLIAAAKRNIKKAQKAWQSMSSRARSRRQPEGQGREKPGIGGGEYFRIVVRDKDQFVAFRTQDVGRKGDIKRLAGKRSSGRWDTQAWLIPKSDAHIENGHLVADTSAARQVIKALSSEPTRVRADRFEARPRRNVAEKAKPTSAQKRAQTENIQKEQKSRRELVKAGR